MAIFKSILVLALVFAAVAARGHHGRRQNRGRQAAPEATAEVHAEIGDAISAAVEVVDALAAPETLSAPEVAQASEVLQETLVEAIAIVAETPAVVEAPAEVAALKVEDTQGDLAKYLRLAKRHQKALDNYGDSMTVEEAVEHHKGLQKYLELAVHFAEQNQIAIQEEKAVEAGAAPVEVAAIAPEIKAAGRGMGRQRGGRRGGRRG